MNSRSYVIDHFNSAKIRMKAEMESGNYDSMLLEAEFAAQIATMHPILSEFADEEIEYSLLNEYKARYGEIQFEARKGTVLFYNSQIANRGALTQQYLSYLISKGYTILFIVPYKKNTLLGDDILAEIRNEKAIEFFVPSGNDYQTRIESLTKKVKSFRPEKTFIHLIPYDVLGFSVFANLRSSIRYYIVHNDHTFWLGKKCADYFIEFRNFGKSIALQRRKISHSRILECPYYPILDGNKFLGFPFSRETKVIGLLASNPYKIMMDGKRTLLNILTEVLQKNENFVVVIAGKLTSQLKNYIVENKMKGRLIPIGQRSDFGALMSEVDIYINSYPLIGGLTTQFAVDAGLPVVTYTKPELRSTNWAEDLIDHCELPLTFTDIDTFKNRLITLINNPQLRDVFKDKRRISTFSKNDFEDRLDKILSDPKSNSIDINLPELIHDDETFLNYYLQRNHNLEAIKKSTEQKSKIEKLVGEIPYILRFKLAKIVKKILNK